MKDVSSGRRPHVHVITPGDHFSPRTGSAVPTVVSGLAGAAPRGAPRARVLLARNTYPDRYPTADAVEYDCPRSRSSDRYLDPVLGRLGLPRRGIRRVLESALDEQHTWPSSVVLGHNLPQLVPLIDERRHAPVLYAHNDLLRTYTRGEARRTLRAAVAIVAVSSFLADELHRRLPPEIAARLRVVVNGVDCELFHPEPNRSRGEHLEIVLVARMVRDKGADVLVDAVRRLGRRDVAVTVVGSHGFDANAAITPYEASLRTLATAVRGPVRFVPFVPRAELAPLLRRADVLVVPSRWPEPLSLTVKEGLASGLAVVASRIGGIPEAMGDSGILVPPDDPSALAEVLEALADDESLLARLSVRGRAYAASHDWAWSARALDEALAPLT